jgi:hypothetical protein
MTENPIIPAYQVNERGTPRLAFWCPHCEGEHRHGDTGDLIQPRVCDPCNPRRCPYKHYRLLVLGRVKSLNALPRMSHGQMRRAIAALTRLAAG